MIHSTELLSKIKTGVSDCKRVLSDMDSHKAKHLVEQVAHAGFHELVRYRKEAQKRLRLARLDAKKVGDQVLGELEKVHEATFSKTEKLISGITERIKGERSKWRGRR